MIGGEGFQFACWKKDKTIVGEGGVWKPEDNTNNIKDVLRQKVVYVHHQLKKERAKELYKKTYEKNMQQLDAVRELWTIGVFPLKRST